MAFSLPTRILLALGYSVRELDGTGRTPIRLPDFTPDSITYAEGLLAQISAISAQYDTALVDSMAVKVDTLQVDYKSHLALLSHRGSLLLKQLSVFAKIPILYNQFTGQTVDQTTGTQAIAIRNYY